MSDLLLSWLNHELQLSTFVTDIERDLASGYLLGEILFRLNQQHNFSDFMNSTIADARIINFCLLEPSLRNIGVKFDSKTATAIMNGKRGAAANVLYQIKMAAERIQRAPEVSTKSLERESIYPLHNMPPRLAKPAYDAGNHLFFEHAIRRHVKSVAALKRGKDEITDEERKRQAYVRSQAEIQEQLEITKAERLHKAFIHSHFIKEALEETDSPAWRIALQKKNEREQRKAIFYQQLLAHRSKQQEARAFSLRQTVKEDLDEFERRRGSKTASEDSLLPSRKSVGYGLRSLSATLEKADTVSNASLLSPASRQSSERPVDRTDMANNSKSIKEQKHHREKRKEQLDRRRKRFLQECGHNHAHLSAARASMTLETLVARETNSEKDVRKDIDNVLVFKEVARENRESRLAEYEKQQQSDRAAAIGRDSSIYERLILRYDDDTEMQTMQKQQLHTATRASERHLNALIAASLLQDMVDFALFVAGKREETVYTRSPAIFLAPETWSEYKVQFAHGRPLLSDGVSCGMENGGDVPKLLSQFQLDQYLAGFLPCLRNTDGVGSAAKGAALSPWSPQDTKFVGAVDALEDRYALGEEVKYVRWIRQTTTTSNNKDITAAEEQSESHDSSAPLETPVVEPAVAADDPPGSSSALDAPVVPPSATDVPPPKLLHVLVFGSPFSGKRLHSMRIAEKYDLALISVHQEVEEAIRKQNEVGIEAQQLLSSGNEIPPRIYSQLVLEAICGVENSLSDLLPGPDEDQAKETARPRKKGWIVYDMPGTEEQGRNFEELLTGFIDPERIPSPFDFASRIAPGCVKPKLPSSFLHGKSGVDLVFYLDCSCETAMERCLGQLEDEATQETFHLVYNEPSAESTERHRLCHKNPSVNCSEFLSIQCLTSDSFSQSHKPWYSKFDTLREVCTANSSVEETHQQMAGFVDQFYKDQQEMAISHQHEREAVELGLMIAEEQRQLRILALEHAIAVAQEEHARCKHSLHHAEESKAKKEELAEHRHAVDTAQKQVDAAYSDARAAIQAERALAERSTETFSGRLVPQLSAVLAGVWDDMESEYVSMMMKAFDLQREQRTRTSNRANRIIDDFCRFLRRPDAKQHHVNQFQEQFNQVVDEMRFDESTKFELHARTDILQDELMLIVETKTTENEDELDGVMQDGWIEDTRQCVATIFQMALQAECDRFLVSVHLLVDGYSAASSAPSILAAAVDNLKSTPGLLDFSCRLFFDASAAAEEIPSPVVATPTPAAPTGKAAAAKRKGKSIAPAPAPTPASANDPDQESGDPMSMEELVASYEKAVQKCDSLVQLVTSKVDTGTAELKAENAGQPDAPSSLLPAQTADVCTTNLLKGINYEHDLMQRRIRFLREAAQTACDQVTRSMRSVAMTLRDVIDERKDREQAAVSALIKYIRSAIEAEVNLPLFIDVKPETVYRFPITVQLREDTFVNVDSANRLVAPPPIDPPPVVEERHDVLLNTRQTQEVRELLCSGVSADTGNGGGLVPVSLMVEMMTSLTSTPLVPRSWRRCPPHAFAKIGSPFTDPDTGLVHIDAFLAALSGDETLLRQHLDE